MLTTWRIEGINGVRNPKLLQIACWYVTLCNNKDHEIPIETKKHIIGICVPSEMKNKGNGNTTNMIIAT